MWTLGRAILGGSENRKEQRDAKNDFLDLAVNVSPPSSNLCRFLRLGFPPAYAWERPPKCSEPHEENANPSAQTLFGPHG